MKYRISIEAKHDLEGIWLYTLDNWSLDQADRYIGFLLDEFNYLSNNPFSGKDRGDLRKGYRSSKVNSHFVFYRIDPGTDEIEIVRVLHERMDISNRLHG